MPSKKQSNKNRPRLSVASKNLRNNKQKRKPKAAARPAGKPKSVVTMSKCASDYTRALTNPFTGPLACIPSYPAMNSLKTRQWAKGNVSTSATTGFGFIVVDPTRAMFNDGNAVYYTLSTFAGTSIADTGTGVSVGNTNAQFSYLQVGPLASQLQFRVVACGVRIRYIGTENNRGGSKTGLSDPTHDTLIGRTVVNFNAEETSKRFAVNRNWTQVLYRPVITNELEYAPQIYSTACPNMGFIIQGASNTTPLEYEFEVYAIGEYQGRDARGQTSSHYDPTGFAAVNTVSNTSLALRPNDHPDKTRENMMMQQTNHYIANGISTVSHTAQHISNAVDAGSDFMSSVGKAFSFVEGLVAPIMAII